MITAPLALGLLLTVHRVDSLSRVDSQPQGADASARSSAQSVEQAPQEARPDPDALNRQWCTSVIDALRAKDLDAFNRLMDFDALLARATDGVNVTPKLVRDFCTGARGQLLKGQGFFGEFTQLLEQGGRVDLLRIRRRDGADTALFRSVSADDGMGYTEFRLERGAGGSVRATDVFFAFSGEYLSTTYRRVAIPALQNLDRGLLQRLFGKEQLLAKHLDQIKSLGDMVKAGDRDGFERAHAALPAELRQEKSIILMRINIYPSDDARYLAALEDLHAHHPDDIATALHSIDAHWLRGEHEKALESIERLRALVGGDAYLDHLGGSLLLAKGELPRAVAALRKALDGGLRWDDVYWSLVAAHLRLEQFENVLAVLKEMDRELELEWNDLAGVEDYAGFVKSPQYAHWLEYLDSKGGEAK